MGKTSLCKIIRMEQLETGEVVPLVMEEFELPDMEDPCEEPLRSEDVAEETEADEADIERIRAAAFREGYEEGKREGLAIGRREAEPVIDRFLKSVENIAAFKRRLYSEGEAEIVELICGAVRKIIQKEIDGDGDIVAGVIRKALKSLGDRKEISIHVNPHDYRLIVEGRERLFGEMDDLRDAVFIEDESVGRGGCLIESKYGEIDARIEKQLEILERELKDARSDK